MPAATPLPRGPSVLALYSADDLLTAPGCPVCRYAAEASDRYLGWFALEGHRDPAMIASLRASLGMCASHTRRQMAQPGAPVRLTVVYRYVLTAARDRLAGRSEPARECPACAHDRAAADRALDTLLDGLADIRSRTRCRELGGVCIPHLADAAASRHRRSAGWLAGIQQDVLASAGRAAGWLAGVDQDAESRARLRQAVPPAGTPVPGACAACLAAAQAEGDSLAQLKPSAGRQPGQLTRDAALCASHLADAAIAAAGSGRLGDLLGAQAARRPRSCPVCQARSAAGQRALAAISGQARQPARATGPTLCVRHHLTLRPGGKRAARALAPGAIQAADMLIAELAEAFERTTEARRTGVQAPGSNAWQRAAAYLDGAVFGGCPVR